MKLFPLDLLIRHLLLDDDISLSQVPDCVWAHDRIFLRAKSVTTALSLCAIGIPAVFPSVLTLAVLRIVRILQQVKVHDRSSLIILHRR